MEEDRNNIRKRILKITTILRYINVIGTIIIILSFYIVIWTNQPILIILPFGISCVMTIISLYLKRKQKKLKERAEKEVVEVKKKVIEVLDKKRNMEKTVIDVLNKKGKLLGSVIGKTYYDENGTIIGYIDGNMYKMHDGYLIATLDEKNIIWDEDDKKIGYLGSNFFRFPESWMYKLPYNIDRGFSPEKGELYNHKGKLIGFLRGDIENLTELDYFGILMAFYDLGA